VPEGSVMRRGQTLSGITGRKEMRRRPGKSNVKARSSTSELHLKLLGLSQSGEGGIPSVAVKCVDIWKNTNGEGSLLGLD